MLGSNWFVFEETCRTLSLTCSHTIRSLVPRNESSIGMFHLRRSDKEQVILLIAHQGLHIPNLSYNMIAAFHMSEEDICLWSRLSDRTSSLITNQSFRLKLWRSYNIDFSRWQCLILYHYLLEILPVMLIFANRWWSRSIIDIYPGWNWHTRPQIGSLDLATLLNCPDAWLTTPLFGQWHWTELLMYNSKTTALCNHEPYLRRLSGTTNPQIKCWISLNDVRLRITTYPSLPE